MIICYNKTTKQIIGTIDGRIHFPHQLNAWIGDKNTTERIIIGYLEDEKGKKTKHNLHLWKHQLDWENPKHPRNPIKEKVKVNKKNKIETFV